MDCDLCVYRAWTVPVTGLKHCENPHRDPPLETPHSHTLPTPPQYPAPFLPINIIKDGTKSFPAFHN